MTDYYRSTYITTHVAVHILYIAKPQLICGFLWPRPSSNKTDRTKHRKDEGTKKRWTWFVISHEYHIVHPVRMFEKLEWYILSNHLRNTNGTFCQNVWETQGIHPVRTYGKSGRLNVWQIQTIHCVKILTKLMWYFLSERLNSTSTACHNTEKTQGPA